MKLLSKSEAQGKIKKDNEDLIDINIRLRKFYKEITDSINTVKTDYSSDKLQKLKEFEEFCKDLSIKRAKLLSEIGGIEQEIERKKEIYYGLITKQDALDEKIHEINEREKKVELRESFISTIEKKWTLKTAA